MRCPRDTRSRTWTCSSSTTRAVRCRRGSRARSPLPARYVFLGYWGHQELTDQVLSADPAGRAGWQLYRTGDLGRLDEHGALVVMGRLDTKVKVRGRFVVLGDVEAELHALDGVADAAVVPTTRAGNVELRAVVVASGPDVDPTGLRSHLLAVNEPYRVPSQWVVVDELPRLPNGKVDRRAVLEQSGPVPDSGAAGPAACGRTRGRLGIRQRRAPTGSTPSEGTAGVVGAAPAGPDRRSGRRLHGAGRRLVARRPRCWSWPSSAWA